MADTQNARNSTTASIHSSPGSSSLPSPPSSPQHRPRSRQQHSGHHAQPGQHAQNLNEESLPGSPLSIASSFPSGASSYMFSHSASSSPPHIDPALLAEHGYRYSRHHTDEDLDPLGLVIPSLTLPPPLSAENSAGGANASADSSGGGGNARAQRTRHRTQSHQSPYGETLGNLELFIFGRKGSGKTPIANLLVEGNDDVVSVLGWEDATGTLTASTAWKDARTRRGARNVHITEVKGFDEEEDTVEQIVQPLLRTIHERFESVANGLSSELPASQQVMDMLASSNSPLPTALLFLLSSPPTPLELTLLSLVSTHIPTITLPPTNLSIGGSGHGTFRPRNPLELRAGLFRSPNTLKTLRYAAAERFEHWREIRAACEEMGGFGVSPNPSTTTHSKGKEAATTGRKESETERRRKLDWELRLSRDVAEAFGTNPQKTNTAKASSTIKRDPELTLVSLEEGPDAHIETSRLPAPLPAKANPEGENTRDRYFFHSESELIGEPDPLHIPTLFRLSSALLGALGKRLVTSLVEFPHPPSRMGYVGVEKKELLVDEEEEDWAAGWSLSKWGIAGIAFAIGYCAARMLAK